MSNGAPMPSKLGRLSGKLLELGQFNQRGAETQYAFIKVAQDEGDAIQLPRVAIPSDINRLLEIGERVDLYLTRRGLWHFCYGVRIGETALQSFAGYRLYFIFNRLMMYVNLMFGAYLLMAPGLLWAGAGLLVFGILFGLMGPPSPRRMQKFFDQDHRAGAGDPGARDQASDG